MRTRVIKSDLQLQLEILECLFGFVKRHVAASNQRLHIQLADTTFFGDRFIHQWLRVTRVITLVVTVASVAHHVDDDILMKALSVFPCQTRNSYACLWVIAIHMKNWCLHCFGDITAIQRRTSELWRGGKANLVVDNQVNRATNAITIDVAHAETFGNDSLTSKSSVTVNQNGQRWERTRRINLILSRTNHS